MNALLTRLFGFLFIVSVLIPCSNYAQSGSNAAIDSAARAGTESVLSHLTTLLPDPVDLPEVVIEFPEFMISQVPSVVSISFPDGTELPRNFSTPVDITIGTELKRIDWDGRPSDFEIEIDKESQVQITVNENTVSKTIDPIPLWLSIIPPFIAILLALIFKEVLTALLLGIFSGAAVIGFYADGLSGVGRAFFKLIDTYILDAITNSDRLSVILFTTVIGGVVALVSKNGGMMGVVNRISKFANSAKNAQFTTWLLGILIFFDDYANTLVVGNTMRPLTDRWKVSREKLSYLVDSTAAPIAAIAFVTTWIGAELGYIGDGIAKLNAAGYSINEGPYAVFLGSLQYAFYPIFTIAFMLFLILQKKDFGPMLIAERRARTTGKVSAHLIESDQGIAEEMEAFEPAPGTPQKSAFAIVPILTVIIGAIIGLLVTGYDAEVWADNELGFTRKLSTTIGNANSYVALLWASLGAIFIAISMTVGFKIMTLTKTMQSIINGFKFMMHAILILILAWTLADITGLLHTADFLQQSIADDVAPWAIPALTFLLAALVSFSTGTSWGTMAILYPLVLPLSYTVCVNSGMDNPDTMIIFYNTVSTVLAGAVLGDHCSPISDTTILSSLSTSCNHIDHVRTQMPYALTVGLVAILVGTIPAALGMPGWLMMILGIVLLYFIVKFFGKSTETA